MRKLACIAAVMTAIALLLSTGCKKNKGNEIRIGVVHAQTGTFASFGQGGVFGIQAAVDDINKQGGVQVGNAKLPIKLVVVDSESDANKAGSLAESLIIQDNVNFLVTGEEPSPMHAGVSQIADRYKMPYVTAVGPLEPWLAMRETAPTKWQYTWATGITALITPAAPGDFRHNKDGYIALDTWKLMLDHFGDQTNKRVAMVAVDDPDGRGWYNLYGNNLEKWGYTRVGVDKNLGLIPLETTDFSSVIKAWKDAKVEILWGNVSGPFFGAIWKQCAALGFKPKIVTIGRGALFYSDVNAWGGDLPNGIVAEVWWDPSFQDSPGIGGTTPQSLTERWKAATKQPLNPAIGPGYRTIQVLADAIQRAGSIDPEKVNAALALTDLQTIGHRVKFDENHFSRGPSTLGQWHKTDKPEKWELQTIFSKLDFAPATAKPIFPIP